MAEGTLEAVHIILYARHIKTGSSEAGAEYGAELLRVFGLETLQHGALRDGIRIEHGWRRDRRQESFLHHSRQRRL